MNSRDTELKIHLIKEGLEQNKTLKEIEEDILNKNLVLHDLVDFMKKPNIIENFKHFRFRRVEK